MEPPQSSQSSAPLRRKLPCEPLPSSRQSRAESIGCYDMLIMTQKHDLGMGSGFVRSSRRSMSTRVRAPREESISGTVGPGGGNLLGIGGGIIMQPTALSQGGGTTTNAALRMMRRRSTRRRFSQVQKAVNFNEWSNKKVQASDNYFFEQIAGHTPANYRNTGAGGTAPSRLGTTSATDARSASTSPRRSLRSPAPVGDAFVDVVHDATAAAAALQRLSLTASSGGGSAGDLRALHDLYVEALYTIVHKVGKASGAQQLVPEAQLIRYAQNAFQIDDRTHAALMDRARKEKPPVVLLNVHLLEARDLIAKDINGFSDPYAMLGVVPMRRIGSGRGGATVVENGGVAIDASLEASNFAVDDKASPPLSPSAYNNSQRSSGSGSSMLQRFGGSFRRKIAGGGGSTYGSRKGAKSEAKSIPARLIKASSVQYKTLNPKWNEKFQFVVDDASSDKFHLDIWDHDDQAQSVLDAVTSLNQISGLRGLGRYFKEVTQSARAGSNDLVDDFLGSVTIRIKDIPSTGLEEWFTLEKRSDKSEVFGQVLLRMWLSTKEERNNVSAAAKSAAEDIYNAVMLQQETLTDVCQHVELIKQFGLHEIRTTGIPVSAFQGILPEAACTILHQHALQGDLTELHQAMCQWLAYSAMLKLGLTYTFLYDILTNLIAKWRPLALDKEEENLLADSFEAFNEHCRKLILDHRTYGSALSSSTSGNVASGGGGASPTPASSGGGGGGAASATVKKRADMDAFGNMIRCLKLMRESPIYHKCVPFNKQFHKDVTDLLVESANGHFDALKEECSAAQPTACDELYVLVTGLNKACAKIAQFDSIFRAYAEIDYGTPSYAEFDGMLYDYISSEMMSEKSADLKSMLLNVPEDESTLILVLKVHCALNEFASFRRPKLKYRMEVIDWAATFDRIISKWVDVARVKAFARVDLACQLDAQIQISTSNEIRHTSSYVDVCHIVEQLVWVWEHVEVRDVALHVELTEKLVQLICKLAEYYVDRVMAQLAADGFCGQLQPCLPPALVNVFCAAINNAEQVRRVLAVGEKLRLDELAELYEKRFKKEAAWRPSLDRELEQCETYVGDQIVQSVERLVRRQTAQLKKHVFHLAWSPGACPVEQSMKPLTDMLDSELSLVHRTLLHRNFVRVMYSQVTLLLQLLQECIGDNVGLEPSFYRRLSEAWTILMDFFHAEGKGISLESFETIPAHQALISQLTLNQMPTIKLIELYYKELLKEQSEVNECKYGILNLRAYYNSNSQTLVIDVIGAKQVIPLDSNGLSDPFVVIELVPKCRYPNQPTARTKVVSKSLNPIFDETFEFQIPPKLAAGSMVHFVVMDHDFLRSNDFAGEALLDLAEVPGFGQAGLSNTLRQFNLILIHPSGKNKESVNVLASRKDDKEAQDFVRSLSEVY